VGLRDLAYGAYERRLARTLERSGATVPRHVGVIVDGNRRWAKELGLDDPNSGHRAGARKIRDLLGWCDAAGVELVTLWLLSTDNLSRPEPELAPLLRIIQSLVSDLAGPEGRWTIRIVGALDLLPAETARRLKEAAAGTEGRPGVEVNVAVGYGGRREIADAVRSMLQAHAAEGAA
jgi:short-chain Z-isoprenyl diphosphate synthase